LTNRDKNTQLFTELGHLSVSLTCTKLTNVLIVSMVGLPLMHV